MGTSASQVQESLNDTENLKNSKPTQENKEQSQTEGEDQIDFAASIVSPAVRRKSVKPPAPEVPNLAQMDDEDAFNTVCNELDQALTDHYSFILTNQPTEKPPTIHQLEKLLEEQGYKDPDLDNPTQREVIKNVILNKPKTHNKPSTEQQGGKRTPIMTITPKQQQPSAPEWNQSAMRRVSLSKLEVRPGHIPHLPPVDARQGGGWARPHCLVAEEQALNKKYNVKNEVERVKRDEELVQKRLGFDAGKFAAANASMSRDLEIYSETTYKTYDKKHERKQHEAPRRKLTSQDVALEYNPSEEAMLTAIEKEFM